MGFNLGYVSSGPLAAWLIAEVGWRGAYAVVGGGAGFLEARLGRPVVMGRDEDDRHRQPFLQLEAAHPQREALDDEAVEVT